MVNMNQRPVNKKKVGTAVTIAIIVLAVLILFFAFAPYVMVPAGHTGVVVTMGKVSDTVLADGLHFKLPWQNVIMIDNRAQKAAITTQAFSSDIQQVDVRCSVNYSVDRDTSQTLYKTVGTDYYDKVMLPRIMENLKAIFSKYSAENLVSERDSLSLQIKERLAPELKLHGIEVLSVAIEDIDFTNAFTDAVESKQVAEQTLLKTETEQKEQTLITQKTAERARISAEADADVARINADARAYAIQAEAAAEAEANLLIAESLTQALIEYVQANNWDGALPQFVSGDSGQTLPVLNLNPAGQE